MSEQSPKLFENTTKSSVQQCKIHNVWHLIKITKQTKKQENMTHTQEKNQTIEAVPEMTEVMELAKNLKYLL